MPADISDRDGARLVLEGIARAATHACATCGSMPGIRDTTVTWIEQDAGLSVTVMRKPRRWMLVAGGPGPAAAADRLSGAAAALGGRTDLRLAGPLSSLEQGLRGAYRPPRRPGSTSP